MEQNNIENKVDEITETLKTLSTNEEDEKFGHVEITPSNLQTKTWRINCLWYQGGKRNQCEKYQVEQLDNITGIISSKTQTRINSDTEYTMHDISCPMTRDDGFYWTENFDRLLVKDNIKFYVNLKMICGPGGGQNRSLSEVSSFIINQLEYLLKHNTDDTYFLNILDGDSSYSKMRQYHYILSKQKYIDVKKFMFVGDMYTFRDNWENTYRHIV